MSELAVSEDRYQPIDGLADVPIENTPGLGVAAALDMKLDSLTLITVDESSDQDMTWSDGFLTNDKEVPPFPGLAFGLALGGTLLVAAIVVVVLLVVL